MEHIIQTIEGLTKKLDGLKPFKAEYQQKLDKKFRLEFSYNSNHMEGNTLTYGETMLLLIFGKTEGKHDIREYEEMKAHDVAFDMIQEWAQDKERSLSEMGIKNLHEILLVRPFWKEAQTADGQSTRRQIKVGAYKEYPNSVRLQNGEMFHYATPENTPIEMGELVAWYRDEEEKGEMHPVELAARLHYHFVRIHPFDDGNGRISRLLMNYVLLKNNLPPVIIKSTEKKDYLFALNQADTGDMAAFIEYIAGQLVWSLEISIKAGKGESVDEPGDVEKKLSFLKKGLGMAGDERVTIKYSKEVIINLIENSIKPLVYEWENQLQSFDTLFISRESYVIYNGDIRKGENLFSVFTDAVTEFFSTPRLKRPLPAIPSFQLRCVFKTLRNTKLINGALECEIGFLFHKNLYEVQYNGAIAPLTKLYTQNLTSELNENIIEAIGNWLVGHIEKATEKKQQP